MATAGRGMTEARTWTIRVPACEWLTSNPRSTSDRYGRADAVRAWRASVVVACTAARLPRGITPVTIYAHVRHAGRCPVRDRLNFAPTIKAIVDGLTPPKVSLRGGVPNRTTGYGFIPDDSDVHVLRTEWDFQPSGVGASWVDLVLTQAAAGSGVLM